jgi:pimeloyl-ACP methyl ester carboxylesterase
MRRANHVLKVWRVATLDLDLPHVRLTALTWGPVDGPLALLLHGFPDTAHTWRHLGPALAEDGWRVVAPFTRGYAPSAVPDDRRYDIGALMADAVAVHALLGAGPDAVLVGHDWGAETANGLAAHRDSPFGRVVSMAVPPVPAIRASLSLREVPAQLRRSWYIGFNQLPLLPERSTDRLVAKLWRDWSPAYDATDDLAHVGEALADPAHRSAAFGYYRAAARPFRVPREYRRWQAALTGRPLSPMLYLHGRDDGCMGVALAACARETLPAGSAVHVVEGAGHFLHLEQPEQVDRLVREFLARTGES